MISEVSLVQNLNNQMITFPGFGSTILLDCDSRDQILPTAMEYRQTKPCIAFREWAKEMNSYLRDGNITQIALGVNELEGVIHDIRAELKLFSKQEKRVHLEIGLSPSVTFDTKLFDQIIAPIKYRKFHLVFIRSHLDRVFKNAKLYRNIKRLFPELQYAY